MSKQIKHYYEFGRFRLDPAERRLLRDGAPVTLTRKVFETLTVLVLHNNHLLTKDELIKSVWADACVEENNLDKNISMLRKILDENGAQKYIETVRGCGYRFAANVSEIYEDETPAPEHTPESLTFESEANTGDEPSLSVATVTDAPPDATIHQRDITKHAPVNAAPNNIWLDSFKLHKVGVFVVIASAFLIVTTSFFWFKSLQRADKSQHQKSDMTTERLTNGGDVRNATLSPDGKYFVYEEQDGGISHLWLRQTGQNNPLEILPPAERHIYGTTFSPDSQFVYYTVFDKQDTSGALYRVPTLGGVQTRLLTKIDSPVSFSPDGKQIAFVRPDNNLGSNNHIVVASLNGNDERILLTRKGREYISGSASWSPDGSLIAYGAMNSPSSVGNGFCEIIGVDVQSGATKSLTAQKWDLCGRMAWTSDGQGFVLIGTKQGESDSVRRDQVWYVTYPAGEVHRITTDLSRHQVESLGIASDGSALLVVPFNRTSQIWSMDASGDARTARQLTNGTSDGRAGIVALPDNHIVYVARTGEHVDLWRMNADGTGQKQLTNDSLFLEEVRATPDGRYLVFASNRNGRSHLFRVDADGSNLKQLTFGDSQEIDSDCSPDGQWVVYSSEFASNDKFEHPMLWKVSIDGGTPVQLTDYEAATPYFSPDGRNISYIYVDSTGQYKIGIVSAEGGAPIKMFNVIKNPELNMGAHWTPDGQALTYMVIQKNVGNIWLQSLNGDASPRALTDFKDGEIYNYAFSRDGTRLFLARGHQIRDALLIKNFR